MSEEPTLPRLPAVSWDERSQSFSNNPRKRGRLTHANNVPSSAFNSSDPAVFSSDDDPALDNYVEGRRKRRYVGTWFSQHPTSSDSTFGDVTVTENPRPKRTWARQLDSGIFLGSDDAESETMSECPPLPSQPRLKQLNVQPRCQPNAAELEAQKRVQQCVESGTEDVVLYMLGLTELSSETVAPLSNLTRIPLVGRDVAFEQHPTQIRLNLATNVLSRLPGALFDVTTLTMLTLRGNQLEELPAAIGKLCNLQSLNVSQNRLKSLPTELLDLMETSTALNQLVLHPNPFLQPKETSPQHRMVVYSVADCDEQQADIPTPPCFSTLRQARSAVLGYDSKGLLLSGQAFSEAKDGLVPVAEWYGDEDEEVDDEVPSSWTDNLSAVPSLMEVVLRKCYGTEYLAEMQELFYEGAPHLQALLQRAHEQKQFGGLRCSRCRKGMVVPAKEWIEWRALYKLNPSSFAQNPAMKTYDAITTTAEETAVPFTYRACSERCGPGRKPKSTWVVGRGWKIVEEVYGQDSGSS
ncbi:leucine rich repeats (2 copies) domain-containing protein [Sarocladium implicatum]|nr:leucine rich repeats (2 copies) domain-containing protein [Sarocladium implicatum]